MQQVQADDHGRQQPWGFELRSVHEARIGTRRDGLKHAVRHVVRVWDTAPRPLEEPASSTSVRSSKRLRFVGWPGGNTRA
jgi:hypothetical protein